MKKLILAPLALAAMFAISSGARPSPAAASPTPSAPQTGSCRWFCDSGPGFRTEAECEKTCSTACEAVC
jgi:hypothetical protein